MRERERERGGDEMQMSWEFWLSRVLDLIWFKKKKKKQKQKQEQPNRVVQLAIDVT